MKIPQVAPNFRIINEHSACYKSYIKFTVDTGC